MPLNPNMRVCTRDGRTVEILAVLPVEKTTRSGERIVGLVHMSDGDVCIETFRIDGGYLASGRQSPWDLVNQPTPVVSASEYAELLTRERTGRTGAPR